jgi:hypothetical protein
MVAEPKLLAWIMAEASRLAIPADVVLTEDTDGTGQALRGKRARILDNYVDGLFDKAERDRRLTEVDDELESLDRLARALDVPRVVDWSWEPAEVNGVLRALWTHVQLDAALRPVAAEWAVPEWRSGHNLDAGTAAA